MSSLIPMVVEQTNRGERSYDIFSRLFPRFPPVPALVEIVEKWTSWIGCILDWNDVE